MTDPSGTTSSPDTAQTTSSGTVANKKKKSNALTKSMKRKGASSQPKYSTMIKQGLTQLNERIGQSKAAILNYFLANANVSSTSKSASRGGKKTNQ